MSRPTIVVATAIVLALTVGLSTASAHKKKIQRQTTLVFEDLPGSTGDRISGVVARRAPEDGLPLRKGGEPRARTAGLAGKCLQGQTVEIRDQLTIAGGGTSGPNVLVATAVTDAQGAWATTAYEARGANDLLFDSFHAVVVKKRLPPKNARHKHVCLGAFADRTVFSY